MYLLFDIGGTNLRIATSSDGQDLGEMITIPTPQNFEDGIKELVETAQTLSDGQKFIGAAGGIREVLDKNKSMLINDPATSKIPDWVGKPIKERLEKELNCSVFLNNDAALVALGEATHGAGVGFNIVAYLTVSTGVGGARVVNGKIDANSLGFEPGFQIIDFQNKVYLEDLISGSSLEKKYGDHAAHLSNMEIWNEVAQILAVGINNALVFWSPDIVVLGGAVMESVPIEKVKSNLKDLAKKFPNLPPVSRATLADKAGLFGALEYLKQP